MNKILIVEDGLIIAMHIKMLLQNDGNSVIGHLKLGEEVANAVKKLKPELIILDSNLEGEMSGIESAFEVRSFSEVPILFIGALKDLKTTADLSKISNSSWVNKPFDNSDFIYHVNCLLGNNNQI